MTERERALRENLARAQSLAMVYEARSRGWEVGEAARYDEACRKAWQELNDYLEKEAL